MLLRSLTRHLRDQNWLAVVLDFLIVVVGVFIGIQVANWNEQRTEREREQALLLQLVDELHDAVQQDLAIRDGYLEVYRSGHSAMATLDSETSCRPDCWQKLVDFFHASQWQALSLHLPTYAELRRNGWPRDRVILDAVESYRRQAELVAQPLSYSPQYRTLVRGLIPLAAHRPYWSNCFSVEEGFVNYVADCRSDLDPDISARAIEAIRSNADIRPTLTEWIGFVGGYIDTVEGQVELARSAIAVVEARSARP